ncbi:MAG: hypothetical protein ABFD16_20555 [Thermoguttaceae bacterium]
MVQPASRLVDCDFAAQDDVANVLVLHDLLEAIAEAHSGKPIDQYIAQVVEEDPTDATDLAELLSRRRNHEADVAELRTVFCSYVLSLARAASISVLSSSYLAAFVVTRSLLELLVNVGSGITGTMSEKISSLSMLTAEEKDTVADFWRELSGWAHPHKRWLKRVCPVFVAKGPVHHPTLTRDAMGCLAFCTDLAFAIAFDKFAVEPAVVRTHCLDKHVDYCRFSFIRRRIERQNVG